jgi:hypothetical protein
MITIEHEVLDVLCCDHGQTHRQNVADLDFVLWRPCVAHEILASDPDAAIHRIDFVSGELHIKAAL